MKPTEREICPIPDDLDSQVAAEHFLGRDIAEVLTLIRENPECYLSDFLWMGPAAFRYYIPALTEYFSAPRPEFGADCISSVLLTINTRIEYEPDECGAVRHDLEKILGCILSRYEELGVNEEIYGDLKKEACKTLEKLNIKLA